MNATQREEPDDSGWKAGCYLLGPGGECLGRLPLGAYQQLQRWMRNPHAPALLWRDYAGQVITLDRRAVWQLVRRDLDACVVLDAEAREQASTWSEDDT